MTRSHTLLTVGFCAILVGSVLTPFVVVDARATVDGSSGGPAASDINGATQQATSGTVDYARAATTSCDTITLSESSQTQISTSGCYYITNSVTDATTSVVLDIAASDVRVFGFNETIDGDNDGIGVRVGSSLTNVTVRNLTLTDWTTAISVESSDSLVANATVANAGTGIEISGGSNVVENTAVRSGSTGISLAGIGNTARRVRVSGSSGIGIQATSDENTIENSYVADTGSNGIYTPGFGNVVRDVRVQGTSSDGITLEGLDSYAENVSIDDTTNHGFTILGDNTTVRRSTVSNVDAHGVVASDLNGALISNVSIREAGGLGSPAVLLEGTTGSALNNTYVAGIESNGILLSSSSSDNVITNSFVANANSSGAAGLSLVDSSLNAIENVTVTDSTFGLLFGSSGSNTVEDVSATDGNTGLSLVRSNSNSFTDLTVSRNSIGISLFTDSMGTTESNVFRNVDAFDTGAAFGTTATDPSLSRGNSVTGLHVEPGTNVTVDGAYNVSVSAPFGALPDASGREPIGQYLFAQRQPGPSYLNFSINYSESAVPDGEEETLRIARNRTLNPGSGAANFLDLYTGDNTVDRANNRVSANVSGLTGNLSDGPLTLAPTYPAEDNSIFPESAVGNGTATHTFVAQYLNVSGDDSTDRFYLEFPDRLAGQLSADYAALFDLDGAIRNQSLTTDVVDGPDGDGTTDTVGVVINPSNDVDRVIALPVNVSYQDGAQRYTVQQYIDDSSEATTRGPDTAGTVAVQPDVSDSVTPTTATEGSTSTHNVTVTYPSITLDGTPDRVSLAFSNLSLSNLEITEVRLAETRSRYGIGGGFAWSTVDGTNSHPAADLVGTFDLNVPGISTTFIDVEPQFEVQVTPSSTDDITVERVIIDSGTGPTTAQTVDTITVGAASDSDSGPTREPDIGVNPDDISYGEVVINESVTESFEISNTGSATLDITGVEIETGDEDSFSLGPAPSSLAPDESANVSATFTPEDTTVLSAEVEIRNSDTLRTVELSGFGVDSDLTLNRTGIDFGELAEGETRREAVTIRNDGSANLTLTGLSITGSHEADFAVDGARDVLEPGDRTIANVSFTPTTVGIRNATLLVETDTAGTIGVDLRGSGIGPELELDATAFDFAETRVGGQRTANLTITNPGAGPLTVERIAPTGENASSFTANRTSLRVPEDDRRVVEIAFAPTGPGPAEANLTIEHDAGPNGTERLPLSGVGTAANLTVSPVAVDFGSVASGDTAVRNVTVTNDGTGPVAVDSAALTAGNVSQFGVDSEAATGPLRSGESRQFQVRFEPFRNGPAGATFTLGTNDSSVRGFQVRLSGTGTGPDIEITPGSLNFGEVTVEETATENLTISNVGSAPLRVSGAAFSSAAARAYEFRGETPLVVAPGASREVTVAFAPPEEQTYSGTLRLGTNDTDQSTVPVWVSNTNTTADLDFRQEEDRRSFEADVQNVEPGQEIDFNVSSGFDVEQDDSDNASWTGLSVEFAGTPGENSTGGSGALAIPGEEPAPGSTLLSSVSTRGTAPGGVLAARQADRAFNFSINATSDEQPLATTPEFRTPENGTLGLQFTNVSTSFSNDVVANATMTFEVNKSTIESLDTTDPEDVVIYRYANGTWSETNTTLVRETDRRYVYRAVAPGFSEWASGAQQAAFEVVQADVSVSTITVGDSVNVNVRIENTGGADGEFLTELLLDEEIVESERIDIAAGGTAQVTFDREFDQPGDYSVRVNDVPAGDVTVSETEASGSDSDADSDTDADSGDSSGGDGSGSSDGSDGSDESDGGDSAGTDSGDGGSGLPVVPIIVAVLVLIAVGGGVVLYRQN